jgi:hypothetical protein
MEGSQLALIRHWKVTWMAHHPIIRSSGDGALVPAAAFLAALAFAFTFPASASETEARPGLQGHPQAPSGSPSQPGEAAPRSGSAKSAPASRYRERLDDPWLAPRSASGFPQAAPARVTLGPYTAIQVNVGATGTNIPGDAANEPSIAIDPTAANRIVIGWRQFDNVASNFRQAGVARSIDGGRTWTADVLEPLAFRTDPVLATDALGTFYYLSLTSDPNGVYVCDLFTSTDGGITWSGPVPAAGGDKQWMAVDGSGGSGDGNIYEFWTPVYSYYDPAQFTRSLDGGVTFDAPIEFRGSGGERALIWGSLALAPDGRLYVAGFEDTGQLKVAAARIAQPSAQPFLREAIGIEYDQSGANFFKGRAAVNRSLNPVGLAGQMWVAVSPATGRVYLASSVSSDTYADLDVHFARSIDDPAGHLAFQDAVRVNDDPPGNGADQWFATMSVAPSGRIDMVWNDTRNNPSGPRCTPTDTECFSEIFYAFSTDEGATWSPGVPITPPWDSLIGWPNQAKIGDYYQMLSDDTGAHLAFAATFNGEQDVYYMRIGDYDCNGNAIGDADDLAAATSADCNLNAIPDECDFATGILPRPEICDGLDNDCDGLTDGGDLDGDGVAAACGDCDDADPGAFAAPGAIDSLAVEPIPGGHRFTWDDQWPAAGSATVYDIFSGAVAPQGPNGNHSQGSCYVDDLGQGASSPLHHFDDAGPPPPPGEARYFMIRGQNGCPSGTGTFGSPARDQGAALSASPCG